MAGARQAFAAFRPGPAGRASRRRALPPGWTGPGFSGLTGASLRQGNRTGL